MRVRAAVVAGVSLTVCIGCASTRQRDYSSIHPISVTVTPQQDALWNSTQDVLRRHGYSPDRVDRVAGVMTTFPVTSQHWFEIWRNDVATFRDAMESSMNPIRRWVEVTFAKGDDEAWSEVAVVVHKERLSSPDRQFNNSGAAYQYFSGNLPSTTGQYRVTTADDRWLDLGRDAAMEDRLLHKIIRAQPEATPAPPSEPGAATTGSKTKGRRSDEATQGRSSAKHETVARAVGP
jgi:hypothetical protein